MNQKLCIFSFNKFRVNRYKVFYSICIGKFNFRFWKLVFLGEGCFLTTLGSHLFVSELVYDLLEATVALTDDNNLYIDDGLDGFPAFGFRPGSEVKQPYRLYLPEKLPAEFTLVATLKPTSFRTSYLFAVLNPFETVVQLGIRISVSTTLFLFKVTWYVTLSYACAFIIICARTVWHKCSNELLRRIIVTVLNVF